MPLLFEHIHENHLKYTFVKLVRVSLLLSLMLQLLLLLQLAHNPTKDSGRGHSLLRAPSIPPGRAATDIAHFRELVGKGCFIIKMVLNDTHRASPYSPNLSSQEGVRDAQASGVPESTPQCVYPV